MKADCAKGKFTLDEMDQRLVTALKRDGRASLSELADQLGVTRTTIRTRMTRVQDSGDIAGYTVETRRDVADSPVRGLMMLGIEGRGTERIMARIAAMTEIRAVHSTNGTWDLIVEIGTSTLEQLDEVLFRIRRMDGVTRSETNLLLSTRHGRLG
jgi:DNA-binding Lrp family transcriptional regulator